MPPNSIFYVGGALYDDHDKITLLNSTNFQSTICGSSTSWLVEFYSSWCGHCIHFAPHLQTVSAGCSQLAQCDGCRCY